MPSNWQKRHFIEQLHEGEVVAYPTEAVFGLGCDPLNSDAVFKLLALKGRSKSKGLILIASDFSQITPYIKPLPEAIISTLHAQVQEPTTWLLPVKKWVPKWLTGGNKTIAIRLTQHILAKELCELAGMAIVSTSANMSGCAPMRTAHETRLKFSVKGVYTLGGNVGGAKKPSRIIDPFLNKQLR
jgi:L-threonylcarbamoyladenylate synthase